MKKGMTHNRFFLMMIFSIIAIMLIGTFVSAGFFDKLKKTITGKATQTFTVNVTVGVPEIRNVYNGSMFPNPSSGLNSGPVATGVSINFSVYLASGVGNMNNNSATINFSKSGQALRQNSTCTQFQGNGVDSANYTCNVTMWWWDGTGTWAIEAWINDTSGNAATNKSTNFSVGETTGFEQGPATLTWASLAPGLTNQTSNNDPLTLNNTGNKNISVGTIQINATNLRGETTNTLAIWAGNISVSYGTGSNAECANLTAINMSAGNWKNITTANLTAGNYTENNGTAQEQFYFCIKLVGNELTSQSYSTINESAWTTRIL